MRNLFYILFCSLFLNSVAQEQDPKAKGILDDLSKTTKAYKTITADYAYTIYNKDKKQTDKLSGKVQLKGQKFKMTIPGNIIVCDGKTIWTHNKDAAEVTIKNFDANNTEQLTPNSVFTIYETGYKYKYDREEKVGAILCHVIDLYPAVKPEKKKFWSIKLYIDKAKKQLVQAKMLMKDQGVQIYEIKSFKPNVEIPDATFIFDTKPFKADQIIDERGD